MMLHFYFILFVANFFYDSTCNFQLFFEDSVRNIQAGKRVGLDTVLVRHYKYFCFIVQN